MNFLEIFRIKRLNNVDERQMCILEYEFYCSVLDMLASVCVYAMYYSMYRYFNANIREYWNCIVVYEIRWTKTVRSANMYNTQHKSYAYIDKRRKMKLKPHNIHTQTQTHIRPYICNACVFVVVSSEATISIYAQPYGSMCMRV